MLENDDTRIIAEAEYTDRLRTVGADYLLCNTLVIFGGGAAVAAALRLGVEGTDFVPVFCTCLFWLPLYGCCIT